jgi:hypothetical protein
MFRAFPLLTFVKLAMPAVVLAAFVVGASAQRPDAAAPAAAAVKPDTADAADAAAKPDAADSDAKPDLPVGKPKRENLITNSPFRIVRRSARLIQTLEIRGFSGRGDDLEVSLTNPATRECHWVKVRDADSKWYVESADPVLRTAVVRVNGATLDVEMAKPTLTPTPIRPAAVPVTPAPIVPARPVAPVARPAAAKPVAKPAAAPVKR